VRTKGIADRFRAPFARRGDLVACFVLTFALAIVAALWTGHFFTQSDSDHYLNLAEGRPAMMPFASRQLAPAVVRGMKHILPLSTEAAFVIEGTLALAVFLALVMLILRRAHAPMWIAVAIGGLLFWGQQLNSLITPDLVFAALFAIFLFLLQREHYMAAAIMLLPMEISRESTILALVCLLITGWRMLPRLVLMVSGIGTLGGILVVRRLTQNSLPNKEHISPVIYVFAKMPWNFVKNILGIEPWANLYRSCEVPRWSQAVHLGPLQAIGVCGFNWDRPLSLLFCTLATFGLLPLLLWKLARTPSLLRGLLATNFLFRFCFCYGLFSYLLAGILGESFARLVAYGWPLFLVALPIMLADRDERSLSSTAWGLLLALHLTLSWLALFGHPIGLSLIAIAIFVAGGALLRNARFVPLSEAT